MWSACCLNAAFLALLPIPIPTSHNCSPTVDLLPKLLHFCCPPCWLVALCEDTVLSVQAEEVKRGRDLEAKKRRKAERKAHRAALDSVPAEPGKRAVSASDKTAEQSTPVAFLFPGQGSQAVGMLQVR